MPLASVSSLLLFEAPVIEVPVSESTRDLVVHALLFAGACALLVGPFLQALIEMSEYEHLVRGKPERPPTLPGFPKIVLPPREPTVSEMLYRLAVEAFARDRSHERAQARVALRKAEAWGIIVVGAFLVVIAAGIELAVDIIDKVR